VKEEEQFVLLLGLAALLYQYLHICYLISYQDMFFVYISDLDNPADIQ